MAVGVSYLIEIWYTRAMKMEDTMKKAIILGATGGIGRQLAKELAKRLDHLVLVGRDSDKLSQVQEELTGSEAQLSTVILDMLDQKALEAFVENLDADLLVNCAGVAYFSLGSDLATANEQDLWQINYHAPVQLIKKLVQKNQKIQLVQLSGSSFSSSLSSSLQFQQGCLADLHSCSPGGTKSIRFSGSARSLYSWTSPNSYFSS